VSERVSERAGDSCRVFRLGLLDFGDLLGDVFALRLPMLMWQIRIYTVDIYTCVVRLELRVHEVQVYCGYQGLGLWYLDPCQKLPEPMTRTGYWYP
jgi:hypothetical protein